MLYSRRRISALICAIGLALESALGEFAGDPTEGPSDCGKYPEIKVAIDKEIVGKRME